VIDAERRVLLVRFEHPVTHDSWWAATGGGVEAGESDHQALRRELREEAGLRTFDIGPIVHTREHTFPWDSRIVDQRERFYLVRVHRHDAVPTIDVAAEGVTEVRWWDLDELEATDERIVPLELAALVRSLAP
jgi:8-oxo-dGTP pyrophosphatase MutT (NUDIX family)